MENNIEDISNFIVPLEPYVIMVVGVNGAGKTTTIEISQSI